MAMLVGQHFRTSASRDFDTFPCLSPVVLFSRNHIDYPVAMWATHMLGGVISGANPDFLANELLYQVKATGASMIIAHPESLQVALEVAETAGLPQDRVVLLNAESSMSTYSKSKRDTIDDLVEYGLNVKTSFSEKRLDPGEAKTKLAFLSFSSGTTGQPKAVAIPHYALIANVIQMAAHNKINENYCAWEDQRYRPGDIAIGVLPLYREDTLWSIATLLILFSRHLWPCRQSAFYFTLRGEPYLLTSIIQSLEHQLKMTLVVVPKFNFVGMLDSIIRHRITHLFLVPPQVVLLCKHEAVKRYDLRQYIRLIMCGAAPLSHELNQQLFAMFPDAHIGQGYGKGMTETCTVTIMWPITTKRGKSGSSGVLIPGTVARVVKPDGSLAGYDEPGELVIKSPSVALGYANNEQAWVKTGDEVRIDKAGEVTVLDRLKEIIKVKGLQVAPAELEGCLLDHPDISNACVVGIPDDYCAILCLEQFRRLLTQAFAGGEIPLAFVVLNKEAAGRLKRDPGLSAHLKASIMKHVADNKVGYKHLAGGVEFVSAIPTSPSGKLLRRVLRDQSREMRKAKAKL
ncbi:uncharacterized protein LACBIDRAFT_308714 [Laccaria bicolor S238N-H82]|uniref:Predicted protein n=1 Tax=Laccaria bicolor (strain S238N-H82 / ATCC MYA-4686) TaxID=486041 RepID=B0CX11_LACBS|nr:uncharacterized protein LACBIDRAFT_308714 [Laccaria bicolor S238N-H82]EDR13168.1 predicted protein [Laccaria bicolor S238N-H82]|eukprot:XP_001875666.1 predicted protein [Laccaria bicolor S238N-H82]